MKITRSFLHSCSIFALTCAVLLLQQRAVSAEPQDNVQDSVESSSDDSENPEIKPTSEIDGESGSDETSPEVDYMGEYVFISAEEFTALNPDEIQLDPRTEYVSVDLSDAKEVTLQKVRAFLKRCGDRRVTIELGYFFESPLSEDQILQLDREFPKASIEYYNIKLTERILADDFREWIPEARKPETPDLISDESGEVDIGWFELNRLLGFYRDDRAHIVALHYPVSKALLIRGKWLLKSGDDLKEAENLFRTVAAGRGNPTDLEKQVALQYLGRTYAAQQRHAKAVTAFSQAIEAGRDIAEVHSDLAVAHLAQQDMEAAVKSYSLAAERYLAENDEYSSARAYISCARIREAQNDLRGCVHFSTIAIEVDGLADAYKLRASAWMQLGEYEKAVADFSQVVSYETQYRHYAYLNRAKCWEMLGKPGNALLDYTLFVENVTPRFKLAEHHLYRANPALVEALALRARLWMECGHDERALIDLKMLLALEADIADLPSFRQLRSLDIVNTIPQWTLRLEGNSPVEAELLKEIDAGKALSQLELLKSQSKSRFAEQPLDADFVHQLEVIHNIYDADGSVDVAYSGQHRELTIKFGEIAPGMFGRATISHTLNHANTKNWKLLKCVATVRLGQTEIDSDAYQNIAALPGLKSLVLDSCDLSPFVIPDSTAFADLEVLRLYKFHMPPAFARTIGALPRLRELEYRSCTHDPADVLQYLLSNQNLRELSLHTDRISDKHLELCAGLPNLLRLNVWGESEISKAGLAKLICAHAHREVTFDFYSPRATKLSSEDIKELQGLSASVTLEIY